MANNKVISTEEILFTLCNSVNEVLAAATENEVSFSAMVQKISRTSIRPDIGCFVLFDGGFTGLVVTNFSASAAMELYTDYMKHMGMPKEELAINHMSDEVSNVMGELMNQIVGDFTGKIRKQLHTNITQNQPKMISLNKQVQISVDTAMDRPQARRVTFTTRNHHIFYLEFAMDKTEFIQLHDFDIIEDIDPDDIIEHHVNSSANNKKSTKAKTNGKNKGDDLMDELGI